MGPPPAGAARVKKRAHDELRADIRVQQAPAPSGKPTQHATNPRYVKRRREGAQRLASAHTLGKSHRRSRTT